MLRSGWVLAAVSSQTGHLIEPVGANVTAGWAPAEPSVKELSRESVKGSMLSCSTWATSVSTKGK